MLHCLHGRLIDVSRPSRELEFLEQVQKISHVNFLCGKSTYIYVSSLEILLYKSIYAAMAIFGAQDLKKISPVYSISKKGNFHTNEEINFKI